MAKLDIPYNVQILLSLLDNPKQRKTELLRSISHSSSMSGKLDELVDAGLVESTRDTFDYNTKWITLTQHGREVALLFSCLDLIINHDAPFEQLMGFDSK